LFIFISNIKVDFLVNDGIDGNSGLSSLSISNNKFSLSSSDLKFDKIRKTLEKSKILLNFLKM